LVFEETALALSEIGVTLAYGSLALVTLAIIFFGLFHWDRQSEKGKTKSGDSAAA